MMKTAAHQAYSSQQIPLTQYNNDGIDKSVELEQFLKEVESIMHMKRHMVTMGIKIKGA